MLFDEVYLKSKLSPYVKEEIRRLANHISLNLDIHKQMKHEDLDMECLECYKENIGIKS